MRKLVLLTFIAVSVFSFAKANTLSNLIDDGIYGAINSVIDVKYDKKPADERTCIKQRLRDERFADKLSSASLKFDHRALQSELDKFDSDLEKTATFCEWFTFAKTPLGICIIVGILLMILSILIALCKCICC